MTAIEQALFRDGSAHCVSFFELSSDALVLRLHPWERADVATQARFDRPRIVSTDNSHAADDPELPWDIIGFDSELLPDGGWRFCLHTDSIEYVFDSSWPQISSAAYQQGGSDGGQPSGPEINRISATAGFRRSP
jgi:hypothetical protein